jgi:hypothetical protein
MKWVDLIQLFRELLTGQNQEFTRNTYSKERNEGQLNGSIMELPCVNQPGINRQLSLRATNKEESHSRTVGKTRLNSKLTTIRFKVYQQLSEFQRAPANINEPIKHVLTTSATIR